MIILPYPPSANAMYRSIGRGRVIMSEQGRDYVTKVAMAVHRERLMSKELIRFGDARLSVIYHVYAPDKRMRDLGNLDKALSDSLTKCAVWDDDSQIDRLLFIRESIFPGGKIEAEITIIEERIQL